MKFLLAHSVSNGYDTIVVDESARVEDQIGVLASSHNRPHHVVQLIALGDLDVLGFRLGACTKTGVPFKHRRSLDGLAGFDCVFVYKNNKWNIKIGYALVDCCFIRNGGSKIDEHK